MLKFYRILQLKNIEYFCKKTQEILTIHTNTKSIVYQTNITTELQKL
jgi:hypothetical protein